MARNKKNKSTNRRTKEIQTKSCCDCNQSIKIASKKCHHCGSYQNWYRFIGIYAVVAGFILTIISILAAQPIKDLIENKRADLKVSILKSDNTSMVFMLSNIGKRPAGLIQIDIESKNINGNLKTWFLESSINKSLIEPDKAYIIKGSNDGVIPLHIPHEIQAVMKDRQIIGKTCDLVVNYIQLNGQKEKLIYPFKCFDFDQ